MSAQSLSSAIFKSHWFPLYIRASFCLSIAKCTVTCAPKILDSALLTWAGNVDWITLKVKKCSQTEARFEIWVMHNRIQNLACRPQRIKDTFCGVFASLVLLIFKPISLKAAPPLHLSCVFTFYPSVASSLPCIQLPRSSHLILFPLDLN